MNNNVVKHVYTYIEHIIFVFPVSIYAEPFAWVTALARTTKFDTNKKNYLPFHFSINPFDNYFIQPKSLAFVNHESITLYH